MNLTDQRYMEISKLHEWAVRNFNRSFSSEILSDWNKNEDSYFEFYDSFQDISEISFSSVPELKSELDKMWENEDYMQQVSLLCAVATFKAKYNSQVENNSDILGKIDSHSELPDYRYVF